MRELYLPGSECSGTSGCGPNGSPITIALAGGLGCCLTSPSVLPHTLGGFLRFHTFIAQRKVRLSSKQEIAGSNPAEGARSRDISVIDSRNSRSLLAMKRLSWLTH